MNFWLLLSLMSVVVLFCELVRRSREGSRFRRLSLTGIEIGCIGCLLGTLVFSFGVRSLIRAGDPSGANPSQHVAGLDSTVRVLRIGWWISSASVIMIGV
jgi:hypothetical protein